MSAAFVALLPIYIGFFGGYALKKFQIVDTDFAKSLLRVVFYLLIPLLVIAVFARLELQGEIMVFTAASSMVFLFGWLAATGLAKILNLSPKTKGMTIVALMIPNTGYALPFVTQAFGSEEISKWSGSEFAVATLTYSIVFYLSSQHSSDKITQNGLHQLLKAPVLWALLFSLITKLLEIELPESIVTSFEAVGSITGIVVIISLGILFDFQISRIGLSALLVATKLLLGLLVSVLSWKIFAVSSDDFYLLLLLSATPLPFNTVVFSGLHKLDIKTAVSAVSLSMPVGLVVSSAIIIAHQNFG